MTDPKRETRTTWPYTSFRTLLNLLTRFEESAAVPPQIDRSVLGGSEGQKTQVLAALKFFGLIDGSGIVQPLFERLALNLKDRPKLIRELLAEHYPDATALAEEHATTQQLEHTFQPLTGQTLRKAIAFYLHAAQFAKHPLSQHFKIPRSRGQSKNRKPKASGGKKRVKVTHTAEEPSSTIEDVRGRYLNMLLEKAQSEGELNEELLDRIERLLGYQDQEVADADGDDDGHNDDL